VDTAKSLVTLPAETPRTLEQRIEDQIAEYNTLHAVGLTAVRHPGDSVDNYRMRKEMERRGVLTMRVTQLLRLAGTPAAIEQTLKSSGLSPDDGDALLRLGGMKMAVDGGFEGGFMRDPYEEPYGEGGKFRGLQTTPPDRFNETVKLYNRLGWRVFTHAVGDAGDRRSAHWV
jgi:predicted amidohydrolase YtcJ